MRILVDICHPAHVHFFKHAIGIWRGRGHEVAIVARDKDLTLALLESQGYDYTCLSAAATGRIGQALELLTHQARLFVFSRRWRPDVILNIGGVVVVHAAAALRVPALVFTDTEHARLSNGLTFPFATRVYTPRCFLGKAGRRQTRYDGYHELAYLHPNRFARDPSVLRDAGLDTRERLYVVRFVSWEAAHDRGRSGMSSAEQDQVIGFLAKRGRVLVSVEGSLPSHLETYRSPVPAEKIHHVLATASLYVGEGATMASEAALLGCPAVYVNPLRLGYLQELEQTYGLVRCVTDGPSALRAVADLAENENLRQFAEARRKRLLSEKIDVTSWLVDTVEGWAPEKRR